MFAQEFLAYIPIPFSSYSSLDECFKAYVTFAVDCGVAW